MQHQRSIRATLRSDPQRPLVTIARAEQSKKTFTARLSFFQNVAINNNTGYAIERYEDFPHYVKFKLTPMERITSAMINEVIAKGEAVRISDVASRLYTTNKQAVRKQMNKMVCRGQLSCEKFKYIGNADICVYRKI